MLKQIFICILILALVGCTALRKNFARVPPSTVITYSFPKYNLVQAVRGDVQLPYNHICRSQVLRQKLWLVKSNAVSSSAMLKGGIIVTAGHNYYSPWYNKVKAFYIECGVGTSPNQLPLFKIENTVTENQILTNKKYNWDFSNDVAFVKICGADSFSNSSSFRLATKSELALVNNGVTIYSSGYPAEGLWKDAQQLTHFKTKILDKDNNFSNNKNVAEYTNIETYKGMSGSAIWIKQGDELVIIGVHVKNGGAYIFTAELLDDYSNWLTNMKTTCISSDFTFSIV